MRRAYRDWIAWSLVAAIAIVVGTEFYVQQNQGMSTVEYMGKIVVKGERPKH
jgi:hypothetical protein